MGLKDLLMRKMLQSKMKDVPPDQQEKIFAMIEKNPDFFQKIAAEVQEQMKQGKDQMTATMEVMSKYQNDLKVML
jgi:hypothetical protein